MTPKSSEFCFEIKYRRQDPKTAPAIAGSRGRHFWTPDVAMDFFNQNTTLKERHLAADNHHLTFELLYFLRTNITLLIIFKEKQRADLTVF